MCLRASILEALSCDNFLGLANGASAPDLIPSFLSFESSVERIIFVNSLLFFALLTAISTKFFPFNFQL